MATATVFDVIVVGGGIAGSVLAGVLARADLGVLVVEKEERFRDRIRGETTWPWGATEAFRLGLSELLERAGAVEIRALQRYERRRPVNTCVWATDSPGGVPEIGFSHTRLQEEAFAWAAANGATTLRPAKATTFSHANGKPSVIVAGDGGEVAYTARLSRSGEERRRMVGWRRPRHAEDHPPGVA